MFRRSNTVEGAMRQAIQHLKRNGLRSFAAGAILVAAAAGSIFAGGGCLTTTSHASTPTPYPTSTPTPQITAATLYVYYCSGYCCGGSTCSGSLHLCVNGTYVADLCSPGWTNSGVVVAANTQYSVQTCCSCIGSSGCSSVFYFTTPSYFTSSGYCWNGSFWCTSSGSCTAPACPY